MSKRVTQQASYFLRVGAEYLNKVAIPDAYFQSTITRTTTSINRDAFVHFMFDESGSISGGRVAIGLLKNNSQLESAEGCTFKIYKVSNDATPWVDTLVKSGSLSLGSNKLFTTTIAEAEAGTDIQGDVTFRIKAKILYKGIPYYLNEYFNHIGLTDKVERLRKKVIFLDINKKSVGEP